MIGPGAVYEVLVLALSAVGGALGAYVAIRVRLAEIETRQQRDYEHFTRGIDQMRATADAAHKRIDRMLRRPSNGDG